MCAKTNIKTHSICGLQVPANSALVTLAGCGLRHARQLAQVLPIYGSISHTLLRTQALRKIRSIAEV